MSYSMNRFPVRTNPDSIRTMILIGCIAFASIGGKQAMSQGPSKIEAESFSNASPGSPLAINCGTCSGGKTLGYYWKNNWFELKIDSRF